MIHSGVNHEGRRLGFWAGLTLILSVGIAGLLVACGVQSTPSVKSVTQPASSPSPIPASTPGGATSTNIPPAPTPTPEAAKPVTVTLTPSKDTTLYEDAQGFLGNGFGQHLFTGKTAAGPIRRAVIAFDLTGKVPVGSTITDVTLILNLSRTQNEDQVIAMHRLLANWAEGTSDAAGNEGSGVPASAADATWIYRSYDQEPWSEPGGDFWPTASGNATVSGPDRYSWNSTRAMVADVQMWLDRPAKNFGWLLKGNEEETKTTKRFDSRENESPENRPMLTITFIPRANP